MSEIENLNTRTDTATETNENGHGLKVRTAVKVGGPLGSSTFGGSDRLNHSEARGLWVRRIATTFALTVSVLASVGAGIGPAGAQAAPALGDLAARKAAADLLVVLSPTGMVIGTSTSAGSTGGIPLNEPIVGVQVETTVAGDFDGDGRDDLATTSATAIEIHLDGRNGRL